MKDNEVLGILKNIRRMCGLHQEKDPAKIPMWFRDDNGMLAVKMQWTKWLEFCDAIDAVMVKPEEEVKVPDEDRF